MNSDIVGISQLSTARARASHIRILLFESHHAIRYFCNIAIICAWDMLEVLELVQREPAFIERIALIFTSLRIRNGCFPIQKQFN